MNTITQLADTLSYEELAAALYHKGLSEGFGNVTAANKWREPVMADKLDHVAHKNLSGGAGSAEYGSDAWDETNGIYAEYKTQSINEKEVRNLLELVEFTKHGKMKKFAPLTCVGVYNGAYKEGAIEKYSKIDHYFGVFHKEKCVLIIKPKTEEVIRQLKENLKNKGDKTYSTLSQVFIRLSDEHLYDVYYDKREELV